MTQKSEYIKLLEWIKKNLVLTEKETISLLEGIDKACQEKYTQGYNEAIGNSF